MQVGSDVYAIGAPESLAYTLTRGVLSAKDRKVGGRAYLQFDAAINSGNSGGPLLNDAGQVIGVITLKIDNAEGIGMAIPMSSVRDYLRFNGIEVDAVGNVVGRSLAQRPLLQPVRDRTRRPQHQPAAQSSRPWCW